MAALLDAGDEGLDEDTGDDVFPLPDAAVLPMGIHALVGEAEVLWHVVACAFQQFLHATHLGDHGLDSVLF